MSQRGRKASTTSIGKTSTKKTVSTSSVSKKAPLVKKSGTCLKKAEPTKPKEWALPALSVPVGNKNKAQAYLDKYKQKTVRRNAPPGEDLKGLRNIITSLSNQTITVQELIRLCGPYTSDQGEAMRVVMNEDLNAFRRLAKKVYETITQDSSDVLLNQQLQLAEFYKERRELFHHKMMTAIDDIYHMAPEFDFERYHKKKEIYLEEVLPLPEDIKVEPEEVEMMKRQAAYHRLQWLRSEGERLTEENNALKKRLQQMKKLHREEQERLTERERQAEAKKEALEAAECEKMETLEQLNQSIEKTIIGQELTLRMKADADIGKSERRVTQKKSKTGKKKQKTAKWNEIAAQDIDSKFKREQEVAEMRRRSPSPFHYSPPQEPRQEQYCPPQQQAPPQEEFCPPAGPKIPTRRRAEAPKDSWGGFC